MTKPARKAKRPTEKQMSVSEMRRLWNGDPAPEQAPEREPVEWDGPRIDVVFVDRPARQPRPGWKPRFP